MEFVVQTTDSSFIDKRLPYTVKCAICYHSRRVSGCILAKARN